MNNIPPEILRYLTAFSLGNAQPAQVAPTNPSYAPSAMYPMTDSGNYAAMQQQVDDTRNRLNMQALGTSVPMGIMQGGASPLGPALLAAALGSGGLHGARDGHYGGALSTGALARALR